MAAVRSWPCCGLCSVSLFRMDEPEVDVMILVLSVFMMAPSGMP